MKTSKESFHDWADTFDPEGDEWMDMEIDKVYAQGWKDCQAQLESAEPVGEVIYMIQPNWEDASKTKGVALVDQFIKPGTKVYLRVPVAKPEKTERDVLSEVMDALFDAGYVMLGVCDGEEWLHEGTRAELLDFVMAADEGTIQYSSPVGKRFSMHMVYGNAPWEVIADLSGQDVDTFEYGNAVITPVTDRAERELRT